MRDPRTAGCCGDGNHRARVRCLGGRVSAHRQRPHGLRRKFAMTRNSHSATCQLSVEVEPPAASWISDRQQVMRAMVERPRRSIATTVRGRETADPTALPLRTPSAPHESSRWSNCLASSPSNGAVTAWPRCRNGKASSRQSRTIPCTPILSMSPLAASMSAKPPSFRSPSSIPRTVRRCAATVFRWAIGYVRTEAGTRFGASVLRLRRATRTTAGRARPLAFEFE